MNIVVDTNFLVYLAENKIFDELYNLGYKIIVPRIVDFELEKLGSDENAKASNRDAAMLAQNIIRKWVRLKKAKYLDREEDNADEAIFNYAKKTKSIVATMDLELRERLKKAGVKIALMRQKNHIEVE
ncbi:MAG: hypothetical protein JSW08_01800 [archaeon]|nr:MAG: hypothetical protein JSW08_01800 [archaeon]